MNDVKTLAVNQYLTLKLKDKKTYIYVGNKEIFVCKKVGINIIPRKIKDFLKYESIDNLEGLNYEIDEELEIDPETEFFVHCSNLQTWENNGYNTDIIHSSIAFPILKELAEIGDLRAKRVFKEEIVKRFLSGNRNVQEYLIIEGYIRILSQLEREALFRTELSRFTSLEAYVGYRIEVVTSCKSHFGVVLQDGKITGLRLHAGNNATKNKLFPYQIKHFKNLETLDLAHFLTLTIPEWIHKLGNLKSLKLSLNHLVEIPENVGKLENLELLDLSLNSLCKIPKEIKRLKNLKKLQLSYNQFTEFPKEVLSLDKLEDLDLERNQIKTIPLEIESMRSLKELGLSDNLVSSLPDELLDMPNIEKLTIGNSNIKIDEDFKQELKKRKIEIYPSGLLEFEILRRKRRFERDRLFI